MHISQFSFTFHTSKFWEKKTRDEGRNRREERWRWIGVSIGSRDEVETMPAVSRRRRQRRAGGSKREDARRRKCSGCVARMATKIEREKLIRARHNSESAAGALQWTESRVRWFRWCLDFGWWLSRSGAAAADPAAIMPTTFWQQRRCGGDGGKDRAVMAPAALNGEDGSSATRGGAERNETVVPWQRRWLDRRRRYRKERRGRSWGIEREGRD